MRDGFRLENFACRILEITNLQFSPGRCIGLSGASGIGKTVFLRSLADLDPHEGRVWLDGEASDQMPPPRWRRLVGLLPAESAWWFDTVGPHFQEEPREWLEQVGFAPDVLGWEISRLSSGERQRLSLLRLLVNRPRVLLLDEPTANLDAANISRVEALLRAYLNEYQPVMIWVSHDMAQLHRMCDTILKLSEGRITPLSDDGAPAGLEKT